MNLPEVTSALAAQATEVVTNTPEEFRQVVRDSLARSLRRLLKLEEN